MADRVQKFLDRVESRYALYVAVGGSGAIMSVLSAITDWLDAWGPIAWGLAFAGGAISASLTYSLAGWGYGRWVRYRAARQAVDARRANPLEEKFERQFVSLADFFDPDYSHHKRKTFTHCRISGPGMAAFPVHTNWTRCEFHHVQTVLIEPGVPIKGVTAFEDCFFTDCHISNMTFVMTPESWRNMPDDFRYGIPIVSAKGEEAAREG